MFSVSEQAFIFLSCIMAGLCCGALYDIGKALRSSFRLKQYLTFLIDLLFWILGAFVFFGFMYFSGDGQLRFFSVLGLLLGFAFYMLTFSKYVLAVLGGILGLIDRLFQKGKRILQKLAALFIWPLKKLGLLFGRGAKKFYKKFLKKDLQKMRKWYMIKGMKKKRDSNEKESEIFH